MAYTNSKLVQYTRLSPNYSKRTGKITKITIHHAAGNASVETMGNIFAPTSRQASANYGIGTDGRIAMYVEEKNRAWTSSNAANDNAAVTIEVANCGGAPDWKISDKALASLIELCVDICKRNGIKELNYNGKPSGNLTRHNMFAATACPGPYLQGKFPYIEDKVNAQLKKSTATTNNSSSTNSKKLKTIDEIAKEVIAGKWSTGNDRFNKLEKAGYDADKVQDRVNEILLGKSSNSGASANVDNSLKIGDKVTLTSGAKYYNGVAIPDWVKKATLYVREVAGDRVVISTLKTGAITGAVSKKYLKKVK